MIIANDNVKSILDKSTSTNLQAGCTFEYNMNSLVDNITVASPNDYATINGSKPFKKLFPIDTIIKPFRPVGAGIKYGIYGDVTLGTYRDPSTPTYPLNYRTYYPGIDTYYKYWVAPKDTAVDVTITYPKTIITNKIVARFELSHSTPGSWTIYGNGTQLATGTSIVPFQTSGIKNYNAGTVTIYYTGTAWTTNESLHNVSSNVSLTSVKITAPAVSGKYIGLIELSPKWVVDVTPNLVSFSISKESSTGADDILPVGKVSANSLSLDMNSYDGRNVLSFSKENTLDNTKTYLYKQVEIKPYFKLYHTDGLLTDSNGKYDKILQGTFFSHEWSISEFGDVSLTALDGSKILQEILAPSILCDKYSATAIIRTLLDAVGFTNYNFNTIENDTSIFSPSFWWTDDSKPVWSSIQELCRDSQMVACFDEYNVLQFYTRDYMFSANRTTDWSFRYAAEGTSPNILLPNISSLSKKDLPSANQVLVRWTSVTTSQYSQDSQPLWKSGTTYMGALSLQKTIYDTDIPVMVNNLYTTKVYIALAPIITNAYQNIQALYEYSGYLVVDSEILEYDAIEYQYVPSNSAELVTPTEVATGLKLVDITSDSDVLKYQGQAAIGSDNYGPSGRYRIKTRGAFGTSVATHIAGAKEILDAWPGYEVIWN